MEEKDLWKQYQKTKAPELRDKIINKYAEVVKIVAGRLSMYTNSIIDYDDLIGYGIFGLIDAIDKFDYNKGVKFETYASLRIRGEIIDNIRKLDWIPRSLRQRNKIIEDAIDSYELENGNIPSEEELANILNIPIEKISEYFKYQSLCSLTSLDGYLEQNYEKPINNLIENENNLPDEKLIKNEVKQILIDAINTLDEKQQKVIMLYYFEELTLKEISKILGVSESRVSQIHSSCMKKLKSKLGKYQYMLYF